MSSPKTRDSLVVIAIWVYCLSLAFPVFLYKGGYFLGRELGR